MARRRAKLRFMFDLDNKDIKRLEKDLGMFADEAFPFAARNTINGAAFKTRSEAQDIVRRNMILRNSWTAKSIQVEQAQSLDVYRMAAIVGSAADYMEVQEFGGTKVRKGSKGVPITTGYAAGQEGQQPRTRLARSPNKLQSIQLRKRMGVGKTQAQRNIVKIKRSAARGDRYVYVDTGRSKAIYRILGGRKNFRLRMVHDLSRQSVHIPRSPWLQPATDIATLAIPEIYEKSLTFQLKRRGLFKER